MQRAADLNWNAALSESTWSMLPELRNQSTHPRARPSRTLLRSQFTTLYCLHTCSRFSPPSIEAVPDTKMRHDLARQAQRFRAMVERSHVINGLYQPGEKDPGAVTIEHVHKDIALFVGATYAERVGAQANVSQPATDSAPRAGEGDLIFSSRWISQRTPVRMGLDMSRLSFVLTVSSAMLVAILQRIDPNTPLHADTTTSELLKYVEGLGFLAWETAESPAKGSIGDFSKMISFDNVRKWSPSRAISIQLFDIFTDEAGSSDFTPDGSGFQIMKVIYELFMEQSKGGSSLEDMPVRDFHWFLAYALSHPSDVCFDRLVREFS